MMSQFSNNPIAYAGQGIPERPFINNDICFISKLEDPSSFSFHLPSPYMHYEDEAVLFQDLHNLELQQQSFIVENTVTNTLNNMADSIKKNAANDPKEGCSKECNSTAEQIPRKKFSKKDRHSKINTARGPRDRRMRLSLDVARKFFDLQDMLGFDKASKTVEWLLTKSQSAILELLIGLPQMRRSCVLGANCASSTSECEVISGVDESATNENQQGRAKVKPSCTKEKKKVKAARRIPFHPQAKHSRDQARERARERTKEKIRRLSEAKLHFGAINRELDRLGSWSSLETGEESGTQDYIKNPPYEMLREVEELSCHERQLARTGENLVNDSMLVGGNCGPSSASFNFQLSAGICNEPQFADLQFYCKSPEAYSNINLSG